MTTLDDDYLAYPKRGYGMDHDRYGWTPWPKRARPRWPGGAKVALFVVPALEWFPLDMPSEPFAVPGGMRTPYPDLRHYSLRDYGNRVGFYRYLKLFDALGVRTTNHVAAGIDILVGLIAVFVLAPRLRSIVALWRISSGSSIWDAARIARHGRGTEPLCSGARPTRRAAWLGWTWPPVGGRRLGPASVAL